MRRLLLLVLFGLSVNSQLDSDEEEGGLETTLLHETIDEVSFEKTSYRTLTDIVSSTPIEHLVDGEAGSVVLQDASSTQPTPQWNLSTTPSSETSSGLSIFPTLDTSTSSSEENARTTTEEVSHLWSQLSTTPSNDVTSRGSEMASSTDIHVGSTVRESSQEEEGTELTTTQTSDGFEGSSTTSPKSILPSGSLRIVISSATTALPESLWTVADVNVAVEEEETLSTEASGEEGTTASVMLSSTEHSKVVETTASEDSFPTPDSMSTKEAKEEDIFTSTSPSNAEIVEATEFDESLPSTEPTVTEAETTLPSSTATEGFETTDFKVSVNDSTVDVTHPSTPSLVESTTSLSEESLGTRATTREPEEKAETEESLILIETTVESFETTTSVSSEASVEVTTKEESEIHHSTETPEVSSSSNSEATTIPPESHTTGIIQTTEQSTPVLEEFEEVTLTSTQAFTHSTEEFPSSSPAAVELETTREWETTVSSSNSSCEGDRVCFSDAECEGGNCRGINVGTCACHHCVNWAHCESDADCGGLEGACSAMESRCLCAQAFVVHGFPRFSSALFHFCNRALCSSEPTQSCFGLPCQAGRCSCQTAK